MIEKLISGGQTGADRGALTIAIQLHIPHGGWCPLNRHAEDGTIPQHYQLIETPLEEYAQRTEWNVRDSDATIIFTLSGDMKGGTLLTEKLAREKWNRPCLHIVLGGGKHVEDREWSNREAFQSFIAKHKVKVLNVAGPRESSEPGIGAAVESFLSGVLLL